MQLPTFILGSFSQSFGQQEIPIYKWLNYIYIYMPGEPEEGIVFRKTSITSKLDKIKQIYGHFWNFQNFLPLVNF